MAARRALPGGVLGVVQHALQEPPRAGALLGRETRGWAAGRALTTGAALRLSWSASSMARRQAGTAAGSASATAAGSAGSTSSDTTGRALPGMAAGAAATAAAAGGTMCSAASLTFLIASRRPALV